MDDVVQESYLRVWKARLSRQVGHSKSFLFQVARNLTLDLIRRDRRSPVDRIVDLDTASVLEDKPDAAESAALRDELSLLTQAIDALPDKCRLVMTLRQLDRLSQKEIAARLGISECTVQVHIGKGLRRIEEFMKQCGLTRR